MYPRKLVFQAGPKKRYPKKLPSSALSKTFDKFVSKHLSNVRLWEHFHGRPSFPTSCKKVFTFIIKNISSVYGTLFCEATCDCQEAKQQFGDAVILQISSEDFRRKPFVVGCTVKIYEPFKERSVLHKKMITAISFLEIVN